jgi:hypothetical protein
VRLATEVTVYGKNAFVFSVIIGYELSGLHDCSTVHLFKSDMQGDTTYFRQFRSITNNIPFRFHAEVLNNLIKLY